jgi:hypothetical protein
VYGRATDSETTATVPQPFSRGWAALQCFCTFRRHLSPSRSLPGCPRVARADSRC